MAGTHLGYRYYPLHQLAQGEIVCQRPVSLNHALNHQLKLLRQRKSVDDGDGNEHRNDLNIGNYAGKLLNAL